MGAATETHAEHRRRHPALVPGCSRCVYTQLRGSLCRAYGSHRHEVAGKVVKTVWLSERPVKLGGRWGIGCVFCATLAEKRPRRKRRRQESSDKPPPGKYGRRGVLASWARFEVSALSQMASRGIRQHAETLTHQLAARSYFSIDKAAATISSQGVELSEDSQLFRGGVPQVSDWLRAWRTCRTPTSFKAAEEHGITNNFINSVRQSAPVRRKAFRSMVRIMMFVVRLRKRSALKHAKSICLCLDDRGAYRIVRYKCDVPWPGPDHVDPLKWSGCTSGLLSVLRRGGDATSKSLADLSGDYSQKMADSVLRAIDRICTGPDNLVDQALVMEIRLKVRMAVADGGSSVQKCLRILAAGPLPNLLGIGRDLAHKARNSTRDPLIWHDGFKAWYDDVFDQRHALVPDIMNSDAWTEKLLLCQRQVVNWSGCQGGGLEAVQHVFRFAKQRFESCAGPQRMFCCLLLAIGLLLAYQASDPRLDSETRKRAERRLEQMPGYVLPQGCAACYSEEMLEFVRLFDCADHDPALTWSQVKNWKQRAKSLFIDGMIFMDPGPGEGMTCLQIIWEAAKTAPPIYYGSKVLHLHKAPTREESKALARGLQEATSLAIDRIDVEFDIRRPEVGFTAFDIGRWTEASDENRQGRRAALDLLLDHGRKMFRTWRLSGSQGVIELEACAWVLVADERTRRAAAPPGDKAARLLDNRILWSRTLDPAFLRRVRSSGEFKVLPGMVSIYLGCDDGTGQVERNLGSLRAVLDAHTGPLDEAGDTISWLVDIHLDGPSDESGLAVKPQLDYAEPHDESILVDVDSRLQSTEFTRSCVDLWVQLHGRRFRVYGDRRAKGPTSSSTATAKAKAKPKARTMSAVAKACRKARNVTFNRGGHPCIDST